MVVYSFHIFDRHAECIYSKRWNTPSTQSSASSADPSRPISSELSSATNNHSTTLTATSKPSGSSQPYANAAGPADDISKLLFGVVYSLRNISTRLGGPDNSFLCYRTNEYKLHYYETLTRMKFVLVTDTKTNNLQLILHQIWATLYVEYVVKNPLSPVEHKGGVGVANEVFERALERFIQTTLGSDK